MLKWNLDWQKTKTSVKKKKFFNVLSVHFAVQTIKVIQSPDGVVYYMIYSVQKFNEIENRSPFSLV